MAMNSDGQHELSPSQRRLLEILREKGPQTLDSLCELPGMHWAQVLLAVDHLSRSRDVAIEMIAPREYQVSLSGGLQ
jgi:predicted transcriptional regulator